MKKAHVGWVLTLMFAAAGATAQMSGGHGGMQDPQQPGMGMQQGQQMMGDQMMSQQMMRDMNAMMTGISHRMESSQGMDAAHRQEMAQLMREMSDGMRDMSQQMSRGTMDPKAMQQMKERMRHMEQMLDRMDHKAP